MMRCFMESISGAQGDVRSRSSREGAITCRHCGADLGPFGRRVCPYCSKAIPTSAKISSYGRDDAGLRASGIPRISNASASQIVVRAGKSRGLFIILGVLLGLFGIHNFYAGYYGKGALQLLITITWGMIYIGIIITGTWVLIDLYTVRRDANGNLMTVKGL